MIQKQLEPYIAMDWRQVMARERGLADRCRGAVMFADISGFMRLTQTFVENHGDLQGADELTRWLNKAFDQLIAHAHANRGSVVGFSGDAVTCWFDGDDGRRAITAALAIQDTIRRLRQEESDLAENILEIKIAVAIGAARRFRVGGKDGSCAFDVLAGALLDRAAAAERAAARGDVILDAESARALGDAVVIGARRQDRGREFAVVAALSRAAAPAPWPPLGEIPVSSLRSWVHGPVYDRLASGQEFFLAELRPVTAVLLNFSGLDYDRDDDVEGKLDRFVSWIQKTARRAGGTVIQLTVGDKGNYCYIAFGAPVVHDDDTARALRAAFDLSRGPREPEFESRIRIGMARGLVRAGPYGATRRCTYGALGQAVNRASRLMMAARPGEVLATRKVVENAGGFDFVDQRWLEFKGEKSAVEVWRARRSPLQSRLTNHLTNRQSRFGASSLAFGSSEPAGAESCGREEEKARLEACLDATEAGGSQVLIIGGRAGLGKSTLVRDLIQHGADREVEFVIGGGDSIEAATVLYCWRNVLLKALEWREDDPEERTRRRALKMVEPRLHDFAPLLQAVLPIAWPDNEHTAPLSGAARAHKTREVLLSMFERSSRRRPLLVVVEDAHWLDSASWALLEMVCRDLERVSVIITIRPLIEPRPRELEVIRQLVKAEHIALEHLAPRAIDQLVARGLGVARLPKAVTDFIARKAEGHPFFSEELAFALRDAGLIVVENSRCRLAPGLSSLDEAAFPNTVRGVVTSRIDRLTASQQLTLKVASVIGRVFSLRVLSEVHPLSDERGHLRQTFEVFARLDLALPERADPDLAYIFKHAITQDVAYDLMPTAQRRELHRAVARWYELQAAGEHELTTLSPLLARHWSRAKDFGKAKEYLERAGLQAYRDDANKEAITFFDELLALADESGFADLPRRARWEALLGESHYRLAQFGRSRKHLLRCLSLLGQRAPATPFGRGAAMVWELARQLVHRAWPGRFVGRRAGQARVLEAARCFERLAQIHYMANERVATLHAVFRALNLSELAGSSGELARSYANSAIGLGVLSFHETAEGNARRARETLAGLDEPASAAYVASVLGIYWSTTGAWRRAEETLATAIEYAENHGDVRRWDESQFTVLMMYARQARYAEAVALARRMSRSAQRRRVLQVELWGLSWELWCHCNGSAREEWQPAQRRLSEMFEDASALSLSDQILGYASLAISWWRQGRKGKALKYCAPAAELIAKSSPVSQYLLCAYTCFMEVYLSLWEVDPETGPERMKQARQINKVLADYARMYTIARPRAWRFRAWFDWLSGRKRKAVKGWRKSLEEAERLAMPQELALAHFQLGRHLEDAVKGREHLESARRIWVAIGGHFHLERCERLLASG